MLTIITKWVIILSMSDKPKKCSQVLRDGSRCKGWAKPPYDYCHKHIDKKQKCAASITHGQHAKAEVLGIPKEFQHNYQQYLADGKPAELNRELALLRTLVDISLGYIQHYSENNRVALGRDIDEVLERCFQEADVAPDVISPLKAIFYDAVMRTALRYVPEYVFEPKTVSKVAELIDQTRKCAESLKKIQEGFKFHVHIDNQLLIGFVRDVIYKEVTDPQLLMAIADRAKTFSARKITGYLEAPRSVLTDLDDMPVTLGELQQGG